MTEEKLVTALELANRCNECTQGLNERGCFFGRLTKKEFDNYVQRYDSKVEGIETWITVVRDKTLPRIGDTADKANKAAESMAGAIENNKKEILGVDKKIAELKSTINVLLIKIFFVVLAAVLGGKGIVSGWQALFRG